MSCFVFDCRCDDPLLAILCIAAILFGVAAGVMYALRSKLTRLLLGAWVAVMVGFVGVAVAGTVDGYRRAGKWNPNLPRDLNEHHLSPETQAQSRAWARECTYVAFEWLTAPLGFGGIALGIGRLARRAKSGSSASSEGPGG